MERIQVAYHRGVAPRKERDVMKRPSPRLDRAIAMVIWVISGLMFGLALGLLTNHGFICVGIGLVAGGLAAIFRTRPPQTIEED